MTITVKHCDVHGRLLSVEIRAALGEAMEPTGAMHVERLNGALRDRFNVLTRQTHAFAKRDATWNALVACSCSITTFSDSAGLASASRRWQASVSPSFSGHGVRADRPSLVVPGSVDDSYPYHPMMESLPGIVMGYRSFTDLIEPSPFLNLYTIPSSCLSFIIASLYLISFVDLKTDYQSASLVSIKSQGY